MKTGSILTLAAVAVAVLGPAATATADLQPLAPSEMATVRGTAWSFLGTCTIDKDCNTGCNEVNHLWVIYSNNPYRKCDWWEGGWCENNLTENCDGYTYLSKEECRRDESRQTQAKDTEAACALQP